MIDDVLSAARELERKKLLANMMRLAVRYLTLESFRNVRTITIRFLDLLFQRLDLEMKLCQL